MVVELCRNIAPTKIILLGMKTNNLIIIVGWVGTTVETQHLSMVCWVLLSRNPTYGYRQFLMVNQYCDHSLYWFFISYINCLVPAIA